MLKKRKGMSMGAIIAGSTAIIALFSPMLRRRLMGMSKMNMSSMMNSRNQQQHKEKQHSSHSQQYAKGPSEVGQMLKQAFTPSEPHHTNQHTDTSNTHQTRESYAQSLQIDENVMNVLDDESVQQVIQDIEHK
ncbi:spore coat protein [Bacillus sp. 179-C3.3 HS]|uniref:spore coat protein n=1 Tax=Bacillus sp. 179-C3.3 HS TaxID=3232162 RepID=UPI0039A18FA9